MGFQCVPQIMGLVRGDGARRDGKGQSKHRANVAGIVHEAFEIRDPNDGHAIPIRKTRSDTYDRTRTVNNEYVGYRTADDVLDAIEAEAEKQKVDVRVKDKATGETVIRQRGLPSTAVIGAAVIFKPPCEVARGWTPEQYDKFIQDCEECMAQIPCVKMNKKGEPVGEPLYLFGRQNIIARAAHWDEGEKVYPPIYAGHWHEFYKPEDQYGKYNGNLIDPMFLSEQVNKMFPRLMRERGWDIDDPEHTDWDKFSTDRNYRTKRKNRIKQGGKSVNDYIATKKREEADAQVEEAAAMVEKAAKLVEAAETAALQAEADAAEIKSNAETEAAQIRDDAQAEIHQQREFAQMGMDVLTVARGSAQQELDGLKQQVTAARKIIEDADSAKAEKERLEREIKNLKSEATRIKDIMIADGEAAGQAAAQQEWDQIVDGANREMADWKAQVKAKTEAKAKQIIEDAKRAASGLAAFVMDRFDKEPFVYREGRFEGRTYLDVAKELYTLQVRQERLKDMPTGVRDAGNRQPVGADGPTGPGT